MSLVDLNVFSKNGNTINSNNTAVAGQPPHGRGHEGEHHWHGRRPKHQSRHHGHHSHHSKKHHCR